MSEPVDLQPEALEQLQSEAYDEWDPRAPVPTLAHITNPVRTQSLPRKRGVARSRTLTAGTWIQALSADHTRASAVLICVTNPMLITYSVAGQQGTDFCVQWPPGVPFPVGTDTAVYVTAQTGTALVSWSAEYWATGD